SCELVIASPRLVPPDPGDLRTADHGRGRDGVVGLRGEFLPTWRGQLRLRDVYVTSRLDRGGGGRFLSRLAITGPHDPASRVPGHGDRPGAVDVGPHTARHRDQWVAGLVRFRSVVVAADRTGEAGTDAVGRPYPGGEVQRAAPVAPSAGAAAARGAVVVRAGDGTAGPRRYHHARCRADGSVVV